MAGFRRTQKMPSILSSDAYLLKFATKNVVFLRIFKGVVAAVSVFFKFNQTANTGTAMLSNIRGKITKKFSGSKTWQPTVELGEHLQGVSDRWELSKLLNKRKSRRDAFNR